MNDEQLLAHAKLLKEKQRQSALATNDRLTTAMRIKAAKKAWKTRRIPNKTLA